MTQNDAMQKYVDLALPFLKQFAGKSILRSGLKAIECWSMAFEICYLVRFDDS